MPSGLIDRMVLRNGILAAVSALKRLGFLPMSAQYLLSFFGEVWRWLWAFAAQKAPCRSLVWAGQAALIEARWKVAKKKKP
jgi:hypothetical protein